MLKNLRFGGLAVALLVSASCAGGTPTAPAPSPTAVAGALSSGLIAYVGDQGVGVLDPTTKKSTLVAPLPAGAAFRLAGPVWGPAPGLPYPVIYFTIHDDRPAESRTTGAVVPYDWLFRVDPFTGVIAPLAANADFQSEGPIGLVANGHYLGLTLGCCTSYEVDALDLTQPLGALKVVSKPPAQAALFTEGAAPGPSGLLAVRAFATGSWYWLNADAGVLNPFPLALGPDDGPIAITADGTMVAVSRPDKGPVIELINVAIPVAPPSPGGPISTGPSPAASTPAHPTPKTPPPPRPVNSRLPHVDALAWSPDAKQLVMAVNGGIEIYNTNAADGTPPAIKLSGGGIIGVDWSAPIQGEGWAAVHSSAGPQADVDALLAATKLPAAVDTPSERPLTKVYLWQYDSTTTSPIASITDATPGVIQQYPPLPAGVVYHHWAASGTWALLGGCFRYRVVITGSIAPTPSTIGLVANTACTKATP